MIEAQEREVAAHELELGLRLREMQRHDIPNPRRDPASRRRVATTRGRVNRRPRLEVAREQLVSSIERQESIEQQVALLGVSITTPPLTTATPLIGSERAMPRRALTNCKSGCGTSGSGSNSRAIHRGTGRTGGERQRIESDIATLGYASAELTEANQAAAESFDRERAATNAAHAAETSLGNAKRAREDLDAFEARLKSLNEESIAAQLEHSELNRVYSEFARFEKFVALVVTPHLGEVASELLSTVTEGKYDRLEFTEDYGIEVYDGEEDRFPLSQYSGGERDVIALCARLALSQVIGGQATTPIQFMVLDEVFGSLDIDRRRNLMEMLQRLMEENQAFQQLFVISHVDDVKAGAMFDEVWRVAETADGVSQLEQVSVTGALEDY